MPAWVVCACLWTYMWKVLNSFEYEFVIRSSVNRYWTGNDRKGRMDSDVSNCPTVSLWHEAGWQRKNSGPADFLIFLHQCCCTTGGSASRLNPANVRWSVHPCCCGKSTLHHSSRAELQLPNTKMFIESFCNPIKHAEIWVISVGLDKWPRWQ